jgi:hypothetical protein
MKVRIRYLAAGGLVIAAAAATGMYAQRSTHDRSLARMWAEMDSHSSGVAFEPFMVEGLPAPAQRWLLRAIADGTPLARTAVLRMHGSIALSQGSEPWLMRAEQLLSPPRGFIWRADVGTGLIRIRGFDRYGGGAGEMRWWLFGLVPVVAEAGPDVSRSAAGRLGGEAALVPATLLPMYGVTWEAVDDSVARANMNVGGERVSFTIDVAPNGRLKRVVIDRWNSDPKNGSVGYMPFVVEFQGERIFDGYTVPAHLRAGWDRQGSVHVFFEAELDDVTYH